MPISPARKALYPENWTEIRASILARADDRCELCGVRDGFLYHRHNVHTQLYAAYSEVMTPPVNYRRKAVRIVLTIHHINYDPTDNRACNLIALCQRCHLRLDAPYRKR